MIDAQNDQMHFQDAYGTVVPIIRLTLPTSQGGKAVFAYADSDQGSGPGTIDFENVPLQGPSATITGPGFEALNGYKNALSIDGIGCSCIHGRPLCMPGQGW